MEDTMSKVVFGSLVILGMVALPGPTAVTSGEFLETLENGASLRMTLYLNSPHTVKGPIAKSIQKSGFRSGQGCVKLWQTTTVYSIIFQLGKKNIVPPLRSLGIETSDYDETTNDASTPDGGGTSTTNPLSNGGGSTTLPAPPAPPPNPDGRADQSTELPVGVSPPAPPSDAELQTLGLPTNLTDLPPDDMAGVLEPLPPLNPPGPSSPTPSLHDRAFGEVGPPALPNRIDPATAPPAADALQRLRKSKR